MRIRPDKNRARGINLESLPSLFYEQRRGLPECWAVYFLFSVDGACLYVGATSNVKRRIHNSDHVGRTRAWYRIAWLKVEADRKALVKLERAFILELKPAWNVIGLKGRMAIRQRECEQRRNQRLCCSFPERVIGP